MLFNTLTYLFFLPIVFVLYWAMRGAKAKNVVIILASCVFYGWWDVRFLALMVATCVVNFLTTRAIVRSRQHSQSPAASTVAAKGWLTLTLLINFAILGTFKYFNFFAQSLADVLALMGCAADMPTLDVLLPVGISFYTFQLSGYAVDHYRQPQEHGHTDLVTFMAFITFFPQLVAGPIERWSSMRPQMEADRHFNFDTAREGMRLLLWGLVKKMLIADNCAGVADYIFSNSSTLSLPDLWLGALAFTFQIYGDFSGYSDMARGSACLFGIDLSRNFRTPYFATDMKDFWRRWHITLMTWFKDYVYIPLGGNRRGPVRQHLNAMAVFLLSGLWHGSNWTFVAWGAYHALWRLVPVRYVTFPVAMIGWVIFRSDSLGAAFDYIGRMFSPSLWGATTCSRMFLPLVALLVVAEWLMHDREHPFAFSDNGLWRLQWVRLTIYTAVLAAVYFVGGEKAQFIYFQF